MALPNLPFDLMRTWDAAATARLQAELKAIRDAGDPVTMVELAKTYPDPPPGRNAATFYKAAFEKMEARGEPPENVQRLLPLVGTATLPEPDQDLPPAMLRAIRSYLADNAEAIELLRKAAALDDCKFDLDFTKGIAMELPHLAKGRQAARLLALEVVERTESGKADGAAESLATCLRGGLALRREPILISALVRIACDGIAVGQVERWASRCRPSTAALERVEAALAAAADPRLVERAMVGERCFGIHAYETFVLKPGQPGLGDLGVAAPPVVGLMPQAYFKTDMLYYLGIMNEHVAAARKPGPEGFEAGERVGAKLDKNIPACFFVSRMILPAIGRVSAEGRKHEARLTTARVALAALRYRNKHGRLPEKLDALAPDFLPALPPDPFDGKPLRYRKDGAGFVVYSVGDNRQDDGGLTVKPNAQPPDIGLRVRWPRTQF
jgi:hypothetical protein